MGKYFEKFKNLYSSTLLSLSKEELIKIIAIYHRCKFMVGETCVDESKGYIESNEAVDEIRNYLNEVNFKFYDEKMLRKQLKEYERTHETIYTKKDR